MRLLTILLFLATSAYGADDNNGSEQLPPDEAAATNQSKSNQEKSKEPEPGIATPQAEKLKARKLGEAFQNFQPSEEISADNAVPFPVDI